MLLHLSPVAQAQQPPPSCSSPPPPAAAAAAAAAAHGGARCEDTAARRRQTAHTRGGITYSFWFEKLRRIGAGGVALGQKNNRILHQGPYCPLKQMLNRMCTKKVKNIYRAEILLHWRRSRGASAARQRQQFAPFVGRV